MSAYVIVELEVLDAALFEEYRTKVPATIAAYGGKYIVRGGKTEVVEGDWQPKRIVVLEFPNVDKAKAWHGSKDYAPLLALRQRAARTNALIVEGV
ncbi:MAG: DUF1330 domain-containing protein [Betaproteobacteria bacterium]|nr:DUF1330 domain-containing protein [Betaproteobacteria bacterium]